ncbi:hypothetical protein PALI_a3828 [Pseudoalteromonas aliena SW19]|uniref:Bacteriocin n=1 Tax=Pseudoalteromonas aliena SW19 TaxID=1314866 RepID=A0ABR9DV26_9GAMM|nr:hypothetical protein [Pseudoalteromonas aliena SW19]
MKELNQNEVQGIVGGIVDGGCIMGPSLPWIKPKLVINL